MIAYLNDHFLEEEQATVGVADLSIQRGFGVFDFFRTANYVPLFMDDYIERFFNSARQLRLKIPYNREELKVIILQLLDKNRIASSGVKMILTGGYSADGFEPGAPNLIITQHPVQIPAGEHFENGLRIMLHEYLRDIPAAKSINYLMAIYLREELTRRKADEVLYYRDDQVFEFPRSNVFIVTKDKTVVTPSERVLHGITRKRVLEIAGEIFKTEERPVSVAELKNAAEVFLTSTTKRLLPVLQVDDVVIGNGRPGEVTRLLYNSFMQVETEYCKQHSPGFQKAAGVTTDELSSSDILPV